MNAETPPGDAPVPVLTVVIPAYNEEDALGPEVDHIASVLSEAGITHEIIVVDDGSTDGTAEAARTKSCTLIRLPRNHGYGAALKKGIAAARSELVAITDADGTYPAEALPEMVPLAGEYDLVVGARTGGNVHIPMVRRPAKWFLRKLASWLSGFKIPDLNSGLRVIRRSLVRRYAHILPQGFSFTTTISLALLCNGFSVKYLPIDYRRRIGDSKIRAGHAWDFLLLILRVMVLFNPLKVFLPMGALAFLVGLAKFVYDVTKQDLSESAVMCLLTAILLWAIGLLADQNARLGLDREAWPQ